MSKENKNVPPMAGLRSEALRELAERVENLDGPCRETDAEIAIIVRCRSTLKGTPVESWFWDNFNEWQASKAGRVYALNNRGERGVWFDIPKYTASIDAAMTLVPKGAEIQLTDIYGVAAATVGCNTPEPEHAWHKGGILALALCAAALRARGTSPDVLTSAQISYNKDI